MDISCGGGQVNNSGSGSNSRSGSSGDDLDVGSGSSSSSNNSYSSGSGGGSVIMCQYPGTGRARQRCVPISQVNQRLQQGWNLGPCDMLDPCTGMPLNIELVANKMGTPKGAIRLQLNTKHITCSGAKNGAVDLEIIGGNGPYEIRWSNGAITQNLKNLGPGPLTVHVTDLNNGHKVEAATFIQDPAPFTEFPEVINESCGEMDGYIGLWAEGGIKPYTYEWVDSSSAQSLSGISAGQYSVTVRDAAGCHWSKKIKVGQEMKIRIEVSVGDMLYKGVPELEYQDITAIPLSGEPPYQFEWSNGKNTQTIHECTESFTEYTVRVTDKNGCTGVDETDVNVVDIQTGQPNMVYMCNPGGKTEEVLTKNVPDRLKLGWKLGPCNLILPDKKGGISGRGNFLQVFPNPFAVSTQIEFELGGNDRAIVRLYTASGVEIDRLFNGRVQGGKPYSLNFRPNGLSAGIYFVRLMADRSKPLSWKLVYVGN